MRTSLRTVLLLASFFLVLCHAGAQQGGSRFEFSLKMAHPNAKALMKEDFFWSPIEEWAPFGSDDGSDAAYGYHRWRETHPAGTSMPYLKELIAGFGYPPIAWDQLDTTKIKNYMATDAKMDPAVLEQQIQFMKKYNAEHPGPNGKQPSEEELRKTAQTTAKGMGVEYLAGIDQAIVGTAFAQFVLEGEVDPQLKYFVMITLQRELLPVVTRHYGNPEQQKAHNARLLKLLSVVEKMPVTS